MTDEAALLNAIRDNPADDTVRLAYADCLDDHSTPKRAARAEFIRVQVRLAQLGPHLRGAELVAEANPLHDRETALLKTWCAAWLPKSLRPGYPGLRVEGNVVWCDPMSGYVRFERGFVAHAGRELPWRPDEVGPAAHRFAGQVRALFAANPLTGFTVSFEGNWEPLCAEIGPCDDSRPSWRLSWDANACSYSLLSSSKHAADPLTVGTRGELDRQFDLWLPRAVREPAATVAAIRELDAAIPPPDAWPLTDEDIAFEEQLGYSSMDDFEP